MAEAVLCDGRVDGGAEGDGSDLPAAAAAPMPDIASATAPASEKADPATDSIEGGGEQSEGEGGRRQVGEGAEDSGETDIGACGVLERLGAEVAEGLRCDDDILTAFFFPL